MIKVPEVKTENVEMVEVVTLSHYVKDNKVYFRITIPRKIIELLGWKPGDEIEIRVVQGKYLILKKVKKR